MIEPRREEPQKPGEPPPLLTELPRPLSATEQVLVGSANDFGLELFRRLAGASPDENVIVSPLSAYFALGMVANGAVDETLAGIRATLRQSDLTEEEANQAYRDLSKLLLSLDDFVEFAIANSIWYEESFPVRPAFVELSREFFDARVTGLDFSSPEAVPTINAWVNEKTRGRIPKILGMIPDGTVIYLINALFFDGTWRLGFDRRRTDAAPFHRPDGTTVEVLLMEQEERIPNQERDEFQAVDLLYGRGAFSLTVLLPPEGVAPADLLAGVDAATWDGWMEEFRKGTVRLQLPRFQLTWGGLLNDPLAGMGMARSFGGGAQFDRLVQDGVSAQGLLISRVLQKTFIDVNEDGTVAAAVTLVEGGFTSGGPLRLRVDRPFLFALRERLSGTILFLGQVVDPTAE